MADITVETLRIDIDTNAAEAEKKIKSLKSAVDGVSKKTAVASVEPKGVERTTTAFAEMRRRVDHVNKSSNLLKNTLDKIRSSIKSLSSRMNPFKGMESGIGKLASSLKRIAFYRAIRSTIKAISQGFKEGMQNLYRYSEYFGTQFKKSLDSMATSALYVKNSLATIAEPIVNRLAPVIDMLADKFADFSATVAEFLAALTGSSTYTRALKFPKEYAEAANGAAKATQKWLGPFDEINRLSAPSGSGSGESLDYSKMFETLEVTADSPMTRFIDRLKEGIKNGDLSDIGKELSNKLSSALDNIKWNNIKGKAELIGSSIGSFISGALGGGDILPSLGTTFGEVLNTVTTFSRSIREKLDFKGVGEKLGEGISNFFKTFKLSDALNEATRWVRGLVKGFSATIRTMVKNGSFNNIGKEIGKAIADILTDIEFWKTILIDLPGAILEAVGQLTSGLTGGILEGLGIDKNTSESAGGVFGTLAQAGVVAMLLKKLGLLKLGGGAAGASLSGLSSISLLGKVALTAGTIYLAGKLAEKYKKEVWEPEEERLFASSDTNPTDDPMQNFLHNTNGTPREYIEHVLPKTYSTLRITPQEVWEQERQKNPDDYGHSDFYHNGGGRSFGTAPRNGEKLKNLSVDKLSVKLSKGVTAYTGGGTGIEDNYKHGEAKKVIEETKQVGKSFAESKEAAKDYGLNVPKYLVPAYEKIKRTTANTWKETRLSTQTEIRATVDYIGKGTGGISSLVGDGFAKATDKGRSGAKSLANAIRTETVGMNGEIITQLQNIDPAVDNAFKKSAQTAKTGVLAMKDGVGRAILGLADSAGVEVGKIADKTKEKLALAKDTATKGAKELVKSIGDEFTALKDATDKKASTIADSMKSNIGIAKDASTKGTKDIVKAISDEFALLKEATDKKTAPIADTVKNSIDNAKKTAIASTKDFVKAYGGEIELVKDATDKKTSGLGEIVKKHIGGISTTISGDLVTVHNKISGAFQGAASNVKTYLDNMDTNTKNTLNNMVSNAKKAQTEINKVGTSSPIKDINAGSAINTKPATMIGYAYANGGFVDSQVFFAREGGAPELVGQMGNRTAVANNAQIVAGISEGVEDANMGVINAIYAMAGQIVNAINRQGGNGRIDWDGITRQISRTQARQAMSANI